MPDRVGRISVESLYIDPSLTPPHDAVLDYLLERALEGNLPVYFAAVPLGLIKPFSDQYDPRRHKLWPQLFASVREQWTNQQFKNILVYQRKTSFIMSDDYVTYYACLAGQPDYVPCWVLGNCTHPDARDVQGPIRAEDLRKALLGADD
jgi:hypothetical protein